MAHLLYRIANWQTRFETAETKKLIYLKWVPVPNKHDGLGFRRISIQKNAPDLFAGWNLILQVASKGHRDTERGSLIRDGRPLTDEDLAMMTGFPVRVFTVSLVFFASPEMRWLIVDSQASPAIPADSPVITASSPAEGKGMEGKVEKGMEGDVGENESPRQSDREWLDSLAKGEAYRGIDVSREFQKMEVWCHAHKKSPTRRRFIGWLNRIERPMDNIRVLPTVLPHRAEKAAREFPEPNLNPKML